MNLNDPRTFDRLGEIMAQETVMMPCFANYLFLEVMYQMFASDEARNRAYQTAISHITPDKTVVEIGPGSQLLMTLMCLEAGARKVYAIEADDRAYAEASQIIHRLGVADRIELIHDLSTDVELPEKVDVCLSELIGCIASTEGLITTLNDAKRFLKPEGVMIPERCLTLLAPVTKPATVYRDDFIDELYAAYAQAIYDKLGKVIEFPYVEVSNYPMDHVISAPQVFEDMHFNAPGLVVPVEQRLVFTAERPAVFDGLLLWIQLYVSPFSRVLDASLETTWDPAFLAFDAFQLEVGDQIHVDGYTKINKTSIPPSYHFSVSIHRRQRVVYCRSKDVLFYETSSANGH